MPPRFSKENYFKDSHFKDSHFKESHYKEGNYKDSNYKEASYKEGGHHKESHFKDSHYRDYRDDHFVRDRKDVDRSKRRFVGKEQETLRSNVAGQSSSGAKTHNLLTKNGLIINSSGSYKSQTSRKVEPSEAKSGDTSKATDSGKTQIKLNIDLANQQGGKQTTGQPNCSQSVGQSSQLNSQVNSQIGGSQMSGSQMNSNQMSSSQINSQMSSNQMGSQLNGGTQLNNGKTILSGSSKSSSFDQQDSGIDLSDQLASNASSQRSSPSSNAGKTNGSNSSAVAPAGLGRPAICKTTGAVGHLISATANGKADELSAASAAKVCTAIFESSKMKHSAVLDKFSSKLVSFHGIPWNSFSIFLFDFPYLVCFLNDLYFCCFI